MDQVSIVYDDEASGSGRCFLPPQLWLKAGIKHFGQSILIQSQRQTDHGSNNDSTAVAIYAEAWPSHNYPGLCAPSCYRLNIRTYVPLNHDSTSITKIRYSMPWTINYSDIVPLKPIECQLLVVQVGSSVLENPTLLSRVFLNATVSAGCVTMTAGRVPENLVLKVPHVRVLRTVPDSTNHQPVQVTRKTRIMTAPILSHMRKETASERLVAGLDKPHQDLMDIVSLPLLYPELFQQVGVECIKGVLLHGPPGTGKTTLVRSVAASCKAALVSVRGSELYASYLGESEKNLRDVFSEAQYTAKSSPCILFIDEIDALCPRRADAQTHENRVVAQLLTLMDGLRARGQVLP